MRIPTIAFTIGAVGLFGTAAYFTADTLQTAWNVPFGFGLAFTSLFGVHIPITYVLVNWQSSSERLRNKSQDVMTLSAFGVGGIAAVLMAVANPHDMTRMAAVTLLVALSFIAAMFGLHPAEPTEEEEAAA